MDSPIWVALSLVLIIEGLGPMLFPQAWKKFLLSVLSAPEVLLRRIGGGLVVAGIVIFYMLK